MRDFIDSVAVPSRRLGQLRHPSDQARLVRGDQQDMPPARSRVSQDSTSPTLRNSQLLLDVSLGLVPPCRAQKLPDAASLKIALSSA